jgi:hypothetical protein
MGGSSKTIFDIMGEGHKIIFADCSKKIIVSQQVGRKDFPIKFYKETECGKYDFIGLQIIPPNIADEKQFSKFIEDKIKFKG